jgi:proteasome lid subunit RPN8/RPN11
MQKLNLSHTHWLQMRDHVRESDPEEACGLLSGEPWTVSQVYPVENELHSPVRFRMDALGQLNAMLKMERAGEELIGIFHSHPAGPASPSPTDLAEFLYPGVLYLIWSKSPPHTWSVRCFLLDTGAPEEFEIVILPDSPNEPVQNP